jgi:hypothetical protein
MTDELVRMSSMALVATLLAFELVVAVLSWLEAGDIPRARRQSLTLTRRFAIRDHFAARRHQTNVSRWQLPTLRSTSHGHLLRNAIRDLQPASIPEAPAGCTTCRHSMRKGRAHCQGCGRRLAAPVHASVA